MKSKSFLTDSPLHLAVNGQLKFGQVLAESYWQIKNGVYKASTPDTSEILNYWYYNGFIHIENNKIYLFGWFTGLELQAYKQPDSVNVERIIFKPDSEALNDQLMIEAINKTKNDYLSKWKFKTLLAANSS